MNIFLNPEIWIAFFTLLSLEIVLGIDNIIFLSIIVGSVAKDSQARARFVGLSLAMLMRILLLLAITWVMRLVLPLFTFFGSEISAKDIILIGGGLFLITKSTFEIHGTFEHHLAMEPNKRRRAFWNAILQIIAVDLVFSLDSVITAVGLVDSIPIMVAAIIIAVVVMMFLSKSISDFVDKHPTIKILALSFLILIGVALIAEGLDFHLPRGYIYFAMAFSLGVEMINMRLRKIKT